MVASLKSPIHTTEARFQRDVINLAHTLGWLVFHQRPALKANGQMVTAVAGDVGFPDLVLLRERVLYRELKLDKGLLAPHQRRVGLKLLAAGADFAVWQPRDWPEIVTVLRRA